MRILKLMADYECFPLWEASPGDFGNVDPKTLPISNALADELKAWADLFDSTLDQEDPAKSDFSSEDERRRFQSTAGKLAIRLQQELGSSYLIKVSP